MRQIIAFAIVLITACSLGIFWHASTRAGRRPLALGELQEPDANRKIVQQLETAASLQGHLNQNILHGMYGFLAGSQKVHPDEWAAYLGTGLTASDRGVYSFLGYTNGVGPTAAYALAKNAALTSWLDSKSARLSPAGLDMVELNKPAHRRFLVWHQSLPPEQGKKLDVTTPRSGASSAPRLVVGEDLAVFLSQLEAKVPGITALEWDQGLGQTSGPTTARAVIMVHGLAMPLTWRNAAVATPALTALPRVALSLIPASFSAHSFELIGYALLVLLIIAAWFSRGSSLDRGGSTLAGPAAWLAAAGGPAWQTDAEGFVVDGNAAAFHVLGQPRESVVGHIRLEDLLRSDVLADCHVITLDGRYLGLDVGATMIYAVADVVTGTGLKELARSSTPPAIAVAKQPNVEPAPPPRLAAVVEAAVKEAPASGINVPVVAIVDDDPDVQRVLTFLLKRRGFTVLNFLDGNAALAEFAVNMPQLILLDLMMPGMTGFDFLEHFRKLSTPQQRAKVIVGSARSFDSDRLAVLKSGASEIMVKPYVIEELVQRMKNLLAA